VIDVFVDELNLKALGFSGLEPARTGRPAYHPAVLLKIYIYGYLNRIQSSRRLERETHRNFELLWLTGKRMPDFKTIADFRKDNGEAIRKVCREFRSGPRNPDSRLSTSSALMGASPHRSSSHETTPP
jgi:transposase